MCYGRSIKIDQICELILCVPEVENCCTSLLECSIINLGRLECPNFTLIFTFRWSFSISGRTEIRHCKNIYKFKHMKIKYFSRYSVGLSLHLLVRLFVSRWQSWLLNQLVNFKNKCLVFYSLKLYPECSEFTRDNRIKVDYSYSVFVECAARHL